MIPSLLRRNRDTLVLLVAAVAVTGLIAVAYPPQRELDSLLEFVVKLVPFLLAAEAVARLDLTPGETDVLGRLSLVGCFLVFFTLFVPQVFFYLDQFEEVYVRMQLIVPFVILTIALALRLGGAAASSVRRMAIGLLLLMVSGIEDLAFLTVNPHTEPPWNTIPDRWTWADHMAVRLGHHPTKYEAYAFIAGHVVAGLSVLLLPGPVVGRLIGRLRPGGVAGGSTAGDTGGATVDGGDGADPAGGGDGAGPSASPDHVPA